MEHRRVGREAEKCCLRAPSRGHPGGTPEAWEAPRQRLTPGRKQAGLQDSAQDVWARADNGMHQGREGGWGAEEKSAQAPGQCGLHLTQDQK